MATSALLSRLRALKTSLKVVKKKFIIIMIPVVHDTVMVNDLPQSDDNSSNNEATARYRTGNQPY